MDSEPFNVALAEIDTYLSKDPDRLWYCSDEPVIPKRLAASLGEPRPIGEIKVGSLRLPASDKQFNPHISFQQLFQFRSLISAIIIRTYLQLGLPSTTINRGLHIFHLLNLFKSTAEEFSPK
ncbi:hypothetical protein L0F63_001033, partial [Massospora cicadina]